MNFGKIIAFLLSTYGTSFYFVKGQTSNKENSDCTKLLNLINGDTTDYSNRCCSNDDKIKCDDKGYITYFSK